MLRAFFIISFFTLYFFSSEALAQKEFRCRAGYTLQEKTNKEGKVIARWCGSGKKKEGPFQVFHSNGALRISGTYRCNSRAGKWLFYEDDGVINESIYFDERYVCKNFGWLRFQISPFVGFQSRSSGTVGSAFVSWNPYMKLSHIFGLELDIGATQIKTSRGENFNILELVPYLIYQPHTIQPFAFGLGIGGQKWLGEDETRLLGAINIYYNLEKPFLKFIDRFVFNYSAFFVPGNPAFFARLGIGLSF